MAHWGNGEATVQRSRLVHGWPCSTISHTAPVAIRDTAEVGGDLEAAATGLVQGAIQGAKEMSVSAEDAASAAAKGALKAAGKK